MDTSGIVMLAGPLIILVATIGMLYPRSEEWNVFEAMSLLMLAVLVAAAFARIGLAAPTGPFPF